MPELFIIISISAFINVALFECTFLYGQVLFANNQEAMICFHKELFDAHKIIKSHFWEELAG